MAHSVSPSAVCNSGSDLSKTLLRREGLAALRGERPPRVPLDGNPDAVDAILFGDTEPGAAVERVFCLDENLEEVVESGQDPYSISRRAAVVEVGAPGRSPGDVQPAQDDSG